MISTPVIVRGVATPNFTTEVETTCRHSTEPMEAEAESGCRRSLVFGVIRRRVSERQAIAVMMYRARRLLESLREIDAWVASFRRSDGQRRRLCIRADAVGRGPAPTADVCTEHAPRVARQLTGAPASRGSPAAASRRR